MHRVLLLSILFGACQSYTHQKYTHETMIQKSYEVSEVILPYRRMDVHFMENGWDQTDTNESGLITNQWQARSSGNVEVIHHNDELESINSIDTQTGCKISQNFYKKGMSHITNCNAENEKQIHLFGKEVSEYACAVIGSEKVCNGIHDGIIAFKSGEYGTPDSRIEYQQALFDQKSPTSYFMRVAKPTPRGLDMEYYSLELPQSMNRPNPYDARWQLTGKYVKIGRIPETGHFSLVKQYDAAGNLISEESRSFY